MTRDLTIPLGPYRELTLRFPEQQLTEADWQVLLSVLAAMKPALVEPDIVDAHIASELELTPDEAIEVSLLINERATGREDGRLVRRGIDLTELARRLIAHERSDA